MLANNLIFNQIIINSLILAIYLYFLPCMVHLVHFLCHRIGK